MADTIELTPSKETYRAIEADVDITVAFQELIDNAIDNAIRQNHDSVCVDIERKKFDDEWTLVVRDDSGGIQKDELSMLFALGESRKEDIKGSIGAFGIGAKKALMRLGDTFTIVSRHEDSTGPAWGYTIDDEWIESDDDWAVQLAEYELTAGQTELRISDLNLEWGRQIGDVERRLQDTYRLYLEEETSRDIDIDLNLSVGGDELEAPDSVEFSYLPWDGLFPRRYEGIRLNPSGTSGPIEMRITVGLMIEGDADEAGTDIFCQNRLVTKANRDEEGGFDVSGGLPTFREETHKRLKIQVEFLAESDAADLPWNAHKSEIHVDHAVMRAAVEWIRKTSDRYMQAAYGEVPAAFFEPYTADSPHAANDGRVGGPYEYHRNFARLMQGKIQEVQIQEKPEQGRPQISRMKETVDAHAALGITCENADWFEQWMLPTYRKLIDDALSDTPFDSLREIETTPPDFTGAPVLDSTIERIEEAAEKHARSGVKEADMQAYQEPRYEQALQKALASDPRTVDDLEAVDNPADHISEDSDSDSEMEEPNDDAGESSTRETTPNSIEIAPFTDDDVEILRRHIGDVADASPEERKAALLDYLTTLEESGLKIDSLKRV